MMDELDLNRWSAQRPPADFADRTVDMMLTAQSKAENLKRRRRWPGLLVLAAAFVGTTACLLAATLPALRAANTDLRVALEED